MWASFGHTSPGPARRPARSQLLIGISDRCHRYYLLDRYAVRGVAWWRTRSGSRDPPTGPPTKSPGCHRTPHVITTRNHGCREPLHADLHRPPVLDGRGGVRWTHRVVLRPGRRAPRGARGP